MIKLYFKKTLLLTIAAAIGLSFSQAQNAINDPIPSIKMGEIRVKLDLFAELPHTSNNKPWARINMMRELPDGSNRMAINDLNGPFYLVDGNDPAKVYEYLDFNDEVSKFRNYNGKGTGFGGFAFHPEFETNGIFFTSHAEDRGSGNADFQAIEGGADVQWVLTRWTATDPTANTFSGTKEEMVRWDFPTSIHGAQEIAFNPYAEEGDDDYGLLYVCLGEGGSSGRRLHKNMQTTSCHLGTIWRIDPLGTNGKTGKYGIPTDNPFVNESGALGEIWAYGFRNPHRLEFDEKDGAVTLFAGDIGEHRIEEVNLIEKGGNYGWNNREGTFFFDKEGFHGDVYPLPASDDKEYIYPVAQYDHGDGAAMALGHVWRSSRVPELEGMLFLGDILDGRAFYAPVDSLKQGKQYTLKELNTFHDEGELSIEEITELDGSSSRVDLKYGFDFDGEVYVVTKADGRVRKMSYFPLQAQNDILSLDFAAQVGEPEIDESNHTISVSLESGTSLSNLVAQFDISLGATLLVGSKVQNNGQTANDFSSGSLTYTVVAENGEEQDWTVNVTVLPSSENDIISFSLSEQLSEPTLTASQQEITIEVSDSTDLGSLVPTFNVSEMAVIKLGDEELVSGESSVDFSSGSVTFTVVAEDGSEQAWTVMINAVDVLSNTEFIEATLYPSSTSSLLNIKLKSATGHLRISDMQGRILRSVALNSTQNQINVSDLKAGLYLALISANGETIQKRFVKY